MFAVLTVVYLHTRPRCSDRVVAESTDPGKQWTATIMERRCGVEAPFLTHVNLRPAGQPVEHGFFSGLTSEGEVFVIEQDAAGAGVSLKWADPNALLIECPRCSTDLLRKHAESWNGVTLKYESTIH
jgi:hypothetical protein